MKALEDKILREGKVLPGHVLKVGSFLNQQLDVKFLAEMGEEIARLFRGASVTKVMTIEASGIALATLAALSLGVPAVIVKKHASANQSRDVWSAEIASYTHGNVYTAAVAKEYLGEGERVLIVDDFLACGNAVIGLMDLVRQAGGEVVGVSAAIEKGYQGGGDALRKDNIRVESLAVIEEMSEEGIRFR